MTSVDIIGRVQNIQATLDMLSSTTRAAPSAALSGANASQTDFTRMLNDAVNGSTDAPSSPSGLAVKDAAMKYIGVPYVFGGEDSSGMDCSGLVQRVYADLGIDLPRLVSGQMHAGTEVPSLAQAQPGDLIVTDNADHIVIYAGDNKVIHAPYEGRNVSYVERWFDESDIVTIRRIIPNQSVSASPASPQAIAAQFFAVQGQDSGTWAGSSPDIAGLNAALAAARAAVFRSSIFGSAQL